MTIKAKILVVEDEMIVAGAIADSLRSWGYEVNATARTGEEALEAAARDRPDLALMDIGLAGELDGMKTAEEMGRRFRVPVVYLTSHAEEQLIARAKLTQPMGYVLKPYMQQELQAAIEIGLYRGEMEQALREAHGKLECKVAERTNELEAANERLRQEAAEREEAQHDLEAKGRLLMAYNDMAQVIASSLDPDQVLDSLAQQIVGAGVFRSLMIAMVDHEAQQVEVVRNYLSLRDGAEGGDLSPDERLVPGGVLTPTPAYLKPEDTVTQNERIVGTKYSLDDDNVTAEVARTGEMMVIDGWDDRFDERISFRDDLSRNVSYFVPVKHGDRVIAVLATGSTISDRGDTLRRVEAMQPLLNQVASPWSTPGSMTRCARGTCSCRPFRRSCRQCRRTRGATWPGSSTTRSVRI